MDDEAIRIQTVCSAHAEVIPARALMLLISPGLLRTRGGNPFPGCTGRADTLSAPHTRR